MDEAIKPIEKVLDRVGELLLSRVPAAAVDRYKKIQLIVDKGLPAYLEANNDRCETIKTLLNRDKPVSIESAFVEPNFVCQDEAIGTPELLDRIGIDVQRTIVSGPAGSGKSVFLKYAFRKVLERGDTYYPVFFELRDLNKVDEDNVNVEKAIFDSIAKVCEGFTISQFKFLMKRGAFYFLIDGYDEVRPNLREGIEESLCDLSRMYPSCPILMSSRPSEEFTAWEGFTRVHLQPFSQHQAVEFIEKISFEPNRKQEFLDAISSGLYERHSEFLSNPLLASMMLLTYDEYGEIPAKRHVFFEKCFQVLLREHDVSKGRYRREFYTNLEYDEVEELVKFFCTHSYLDRAFSFNLEQLKQYTEDALGSTNYDVKPSQVIEDFVESIGLLQRDGGHFEFVHRSFQEYFFAKFVVSDRDHSLRDKLSELGVLWFFDDTIEMIADMNKSYFCSDFLLPEAKRVFSAIKNIDPSKRPSSILSKMWESVSVSTHGDDDEKHITYGIRLVPENQKRSWLNYIYQRAQERESIRSQLPRVKDIDDVQPEVIRIAETKGRIPLHHMNDELLVKLGCNTMAGRMKKAIELLILELEDERTGRKSSLATRMKNKKRQ